MSVGVLPICLSVHYIMSVSLETRRDHLELEFQKVVSFHVGAGKRTWASGRATSAPRHWAISPASGFRLLILLPECPDFCLGLLMYSTTHNSFKIIMNTVIWNFQWSCYSLDPELIGLLSPSLSSSFLYVPLLPSSFYTHQADSLPLTYVWFFKWILVNIQVCNIMHWPLGKCRFTELHRSFKYWHFIQ